MLGTIDPALVAVRDVSSVIYSGRDNVTTARFVMYDPARMRDVPLDFSGVTRMALVFPTAEPRWAFDTLTSPGVIDWSQGEGVVQFDLSQFALAPGVYTVHLVVFGPSATHGVVLCDGSNPFTLEVRHVAAYGSLPPPLPPENTIAGHPVNVSNLENGDLLVFYGSEWTNENKTEVTDGGNF